MSAVQAIRAWWHSRDRREQWLLGTMCLMLAAFAYWYGMLVPLRLLANRTLQDYDRAAADVVLVRQQADALARLRNDAPRGTITLEAVRASARAAGIAIRTSPGSETGRLDIQVDEVPATQLFAWLDALREVHRVDPGVLHVERRESGVSARFDLPANPGAAGGDRKE